MRSETGKGRRRKEEGLGDDPVAPGPPRLLLPGVSVLVALASVLKRVNQTALGELSGLRYKTVNAFLAGSIGRTDTKQLVRALECSPAEVRILWACLEAWTGLDTKYFSSEELDWIEMEVAETARNRRQELKLALRGGPPQGVVEERDFAAERWRGEELREGLTRGLDAEERTAIVSTVAKYHTWSFAAGCADWSLRQASKNVASAIEWAELGCLAAEKLSDDPSGLTASRVQGYCRAHLGNGVRIQGELPRSEGEMLTAIDLWDRGTDPEGLLDPGRVLELAASLRKDQRRPAEALRLLNRAAPVSRRPAHVTLKTGVTLSVMGEYEAAIEELLRAGELIEGQGEPRLKNVQRFGLASAYCHLHRHEEAAVLLPEIRRLAAHLGDELDLERADWLEGRIARGFGDHEKALRLLEAAAAAFDGREMDYDVALARFEAATIHLEMGRAERSAEIAGELVERFAKNGVDEEASKALRLYVEAIATQSVTNELARSVLRYLHLAQHQRLEF